MKKIFILLVIGFCCSVSRAQTFFYPDPPVISTFNACDSVGVQISGMFNDGCSYFYMPEFNLQVSGNNVYLHITARNNGCDSGWICTMALVPTSGTYYFAPVNTSGVFNVQLVVHNKCMGQDQMDTLAATGGPFTATTFAATSTLSSNAGPVVTLGMPVIYNLNTNIPFNYTSRWFRNGQLAYTAANTNTWSTSIQTMSDTVEVEVVNDSICIDSSATWSNSVILNVTPNTINEKADRDLEFHFDRSKGFLYFKNVVESAEVEVLDITGKRMFRGRISASENGVQLPVNSAGIYLLHIRDHMVDKWYKF